MKHRSHRRDDGDRALLQELVDSCVAPSSAPHLPRVSVVVPSFNQARYLPRTIRSLVNQNYPNLEIIVVDGDSTDGTLSVLRDLSPHLAYWVSEPDGGQSDALNKGFMRATGEIFGWMNADDLYLPGAVARAASLLSARPDVDLVFGDHVEIDEADQVLQRVFSFPASRGQLAYEGFFANAQSMFWRSDLHRRAGPFDVGLHRTMDYDMMLRFVDAAEGALLHLPEPLGCFRRHDEQKTRVLDETVQREHREIASRLIPHKYTRLGGLLRRLYRVRRLYWYWRRGGNRFVVTTALTSLTRKHVDVL